jgi:PPOX class probable F420-dependent enzyme
MSLHFGPRLSAFLAEPLLVALGTTRRDGSVQLNPVWYEYRDGLFWLNGGPRRGWFLHLRRDPRITLLVSDAATFRWVQVQGRLLDSTTDGADDHIDHLSQRYHDRPYPAPKIDRLIVRVAPERVVGGDRQQPWDVE